MKKINIIKLDYIHIATIQKKLSSSVTNLMVDSDSFANGRKFSVLVLVQYDHQVADFSHQHAEQPSQPPAGDQGGAVHRPMAQNIRSFVAQVLSHRVSPHPCLYVQKK